jgi:hypothetical protein
MSARSYHLPDFSNKNLPVCSIVTSSPYQYESCLHLTQLWIRTSPLGPLVMSLSHMIGTLICMGDVVMPYKVALNHNMESSKHRHIFKLMFLSS